MSSPATHPPVRRHLTERQVDTVQRLCDAAVEEVRMLGYEGLTVRNVARRAGVAPATAYTYFSSKDHLVAELFWRRLQQLPVVQVDRRKSPANRISAALHDVGLLVADEPELASACTTALLSNDPDVGRLRDRIGGAIGERISSALGDDADAAVERSLNLMWSGAMLQAGIGYLPYSELADRLAEATRLIFESRAER
jgi:AcrR family transcriptional regulator